MVDYTYSMSQEIPHQIRHANKTMLAFVVFNILVQLALIPISGWVHINFDLATPIVGIVFVIIYFQTSRKSVGDVLQFQGIPFKSFLLISIAAIVTLYFLTPFFAWFGQFINPVDVTTEQIFLDILKDNGAVSFILFGTFVAPFVEEVVFRGVLMTGYKHTSTVVAVIVTALFFALNHVALDQIVYVFFVGIVLALVALITRSLLASIWVHILFNGLSTMAAIWFYSVQPELGEQAQAVDVRSEFISNWPYLLIAFFVGVVILYFVFRKLAKIHDFKFTWDRHPFVDMYFVAAMLVSIGMAVVYLVIS